MAKDVESILAAYDAGGKEAAEAAYQAICKRNRLKNFEAFMLSKAVCDALKKREG